MEESKSQAKTFDPLKGLTWNADTDVELIKKLVREKDSIFAKHRELDTSSLQAASQAIARTLGTNDSSLRPCLDRYCEFCKVVDIPVFPLSASTIALFMFAKCSFKNSYYETTARRMRRIKRETDTLWEEVDGYDALMEEDDEILDALREFFAERKDVRIRSQLPTSGPRRRSKARSDSDDSDSDLSNLTYKSDEDDEDYSEDGDDRAWRQRKARELRSESQAPNQPVVTSNVPQDGDRFANIEELLVACYRALLPLYGNGCNITNSQDGAPTVIECSRASHNYRNAEGGKCKWKIEAVVDQETNELVVSEEKSHLAHNHGPSTRIIKHPSWRPPVKNAIVRKAFGMPPLASASKEKAKSKVTSSPSTIRSSPFSSNDSKLDEQSSKKLKYTPYQFNSTQNSQYSPYSSMLTHSSTNVQSNSQISKSSHFAHYPQLASSSTTSLASPHPAHGFSMPQSHSSFALPTVLASTSLAQSAAPPLSPFFPQLERFLRALHPSLSVLAIPLFNAGIDSFELLCLFNAFESETLARFLQLVKSQDVKQEISNVHLRLLQKKHEEAKVGDWSG